MSAVSGDSEFGSTLAFISVSNMPKNPPPPICTKCSKPMQFLPRKNIGGRRFQCPDFEDCDPVRSSVAKLPTGELALEVRPKAASLNVLSLDLGHYATTVLTRKRALRTAINRPVALICRSSVRSAYVGKAELGL